MKKFMNKLKGDKSDAGSSDAPVKSTSTSSQPSSTTQSAAANEPSGASAAGGSTGDAAKGVLFTTTLGDIAIALYTDETPKVRLRFLVSNLKLIRSPLDMSQLLDSGVNRQIR